MSIAGVVNAVKVSWKGRARNYRYAIVVPMPHLRLPDTLKCCLMCGGCVKNCYHRSRPGLVRKVEIAFFQRQLMDHTETCPSAQMILRGEGLRHDEENAEVSKSNLTGRMYEIWDPFEDDKVPTHIQDAVCDLQLGMGRTPDQFRMRCAQIRDMIEQAKLKQDGEQRQKDEALGSSQNGDTIPPPTTTAEENRQLQEDLRLSRVDFKGRQGEKDGPNAAVDSKIEMSMLKSPKFSVHSLKR
jgi:hypothetical protein